MANFERVPRATATDGAGRRPLEQAVIARLVLAPQRRTQILEPRTQTEGDLAAHGNFCWCPGRKNMSHQKSIGEIIIASAPHSFIQPICQINYTVCKNCRVELHETIGGDKHGSQEKSGKESW